MSVGSPPLCICLSNGYWSCFPGVRRTERDVDHSSSSSAAADTAWIYVSSLTPRLHVRNRQHFMLNYTHIQLSELVFECNGLHRLNSLIRLTTGPLVITELQVSCSKTGSCDEFKLKDQVNLLWQVTGYYNQEG